MKTPIWEPSQERIRNANITRFTDYINARYNQKIDSYSGLHRWSIDNPADFCNATDASQVMETSPAEPATPTGGILLNAEKVIQELEKSHVLIERTVAAERAGQCAHRGGLTDVVMEYVELLGHERGYLWAIYYSRKRLLP